MSRILYESEDLSIVEFAGPIGVGVAVQITAQVLGDGQWLYIQLTADQLRRMLENLPHTNDAMQKRWEAIEKRIQDLEGYCRLNQNIRPT